MISILEVNEQNQASIVEMLLKPDGIAMEADETFALWFSFKAGAFGESPILRDTLQGTVLDSDSKIKLYQRN